jgi:hypothetical protein
MSQRESGQATMALKKSQIYSTLWRSCDELRGGMDASRYKDYVLTLLFVWRTHRTTHNQMPLRHEDWSY